MENIMNELENLLKDLYKISGLNMSIFDLNQNLLASYPHKKSKFCNELEKNNIAFQHCIDCDYKAMEHVKKTGELYIYKCHFGLNEAIMPLYSYGSLTGYLMMGQAVIGTYRNYSEIIEKSKEYFQDKEILKKYIDGIEKWISHPDGKTTPLHHIITVERMASLAKAELSGTNKLVELLKMNQKGN